MFKSLCGICECLQGLTDCICGCCGDDYGEIENKSEADRYSNDDERGICDRDVYNGGNCFRFAFGLAKKDIEIFDTKFEGVLSEECDINALNPNGSEISVQSKQGAEANEEEKSSLKRNIEKYFDEHKNEIPIGIREIDNPENSNTNWVVCVLYGPLGHHYLRSNDKGKSWYYKNGPGNFIRMSKRTEVTSDRYPYLVCYYEVTLKNKKGDQL